MKISDKEKVMLAVIGIIGVTVGYYYIGYKPMSENIAAKKLELAALNDQYSQMQSEIAMMETNQKDIKLLEFSIDDASSKIYPDIWQPKLIKELSDLGKKANIDITFSYAKESYAPISDYFTSKEEEVVMANSLETLIEEYNSKMPEDKQIKYKKASENDAKVSEKEEEAKEADSSINVKQMTVNTTFKGSYDNVIKFIKLVEDYKYLVAIPNITMAPSGNSEISGSLSMEFYSAPRLNGDFDGYYDWKPESKSGKDNPFEDSFASIKSVENDEAEETSINISLRPFNSDMPSVTIARPNDSTGRTKLLNDDNAISEITVEFTEKNGEYFVKYKLGEDVYPKAGDGITFVPKGNIKIAVASEKRTNQQDLVATKLKVKNTTKKKVEVLITGDDKDNPRVKISTDGNVEYVSK